MQIHWQIVMFLHRFLNSENVRKDLSLVVRCASRENVAVLQNRLERRRIPQLQWIGRLHVIMSVDQNCAASGLMFVARPNNRMPTRWDELRLQADAREFFHQPTCALLKLLLVLIVGRDTRKPQERVIVCKMIFAHGQKTNGFFADCLRLPPSIYREARARRTAYMIEASVNTIPVTKNSRSVA